VSDPLDAALIARLNGPAGPHTQPSITAAEFVAIERPPIRPYVATLDGRSILFAQNTSLLLGGPSGVAKSLQLVDLCGKLASRGPARWLGLNVCGGLTVLLVVYDGEGSDEDVRERIAQLVPPDALERLFVWDRWRLGSAPAADEEGVRALAAEAKRVSADVVALDTAPAFFSRIYPTGTGVPEEAHRELERVRELADRPLGFLMNAHTRKRDIRAAAKALDELEELAGTFVKKVDAAIVIRRDGNDRGPRRRITFAKVRRGPDVEPIIATLPTEPGEPPRLTVVADLGGTHKRDGTDADTIAAWVRDQGHPVPVASLCDQFGISDSTLRRRRDELAQLGIEHRLLLGGEGNAHGYGCAEQWERIALPQDMEQTA
jgi:hypothetical protein